MTKSAIDHARRRGRLHDRYPGVYSVVPTEFLTEDALLIAAFLAVGKHAVLGRGTAAWRFKLLCAPPVGIELITPCAHVAPPGITLIRGRPLRPSDITLNARFRSTTVARTLLDLAVLYETEPLLRALEQAEFEHGLQPEDVLQTLRRGHPGSKNLRATLDLHVPGYGKVKSELERRFRRLLIANRVELPERNVLLGPWEVDCLWPAQRVVVELDGRQHERSHQRAKDSDRDLWLRAGGYTVVRYTWQQVTRQPDLVIEDLTGLLAQAVAA
jgi:very-short-patch-repair endonuclease